MKLRPRHLLSLHVGCCRLVAGRPPPVCRLVVGVVLFVTFPERAHGTMRPAVWCAQGRGARMPVPGAGSEKATSTSQVRVASAILFITVGLAALGLVLLPQDRWLTLESVGQVAGNGLFMLACSAVGILIVARRPGNVIGWIYLLVPLVHGRLRGCRWLRWPLAARFQVGGAAPRPPVDSHCPRGRNAVDAAVSHRPPAVTALAADGLGHGGCHRGGRG